VSDIFTSRIKKVEASGIRKVFELAMKSKGEMINLSIGQPHFPVPEELKRAAEKAIREDKNSYTPTLGILPLREKIAEKLTKENNIKANPDNIIITAGVSGAIFLLLSSILEDGQEIIVPDPYFVMYKQVVNFLGGKLVPLDTYPDFHINPDKLEALITPKTKAIFLNSCNNPTGAVYSREELEKIAAVAGKHGLLIISDEIYEKFDYDKKFFSIGSIYENTVTMNGFSKSHAVTGWRVGYAHGPKEIIESMNKLQQYTFVCAPSFAQTALAETFDLDFSSLYQQYDQNRIKLYEGLKDLYDIRKSEGAFYSFIKIPEGQKNFIEKLAENNLLVVPGSVFSECNEYFRVCFSVDNSSIDKAIQIFRSVIQ